MNNAPVYDIINVDDKCIEEGDFCVKSHAEYKLEVMRKNGDTRNLEIVIRDGRYDYIRRP